MELVTEARNASLTDMIEILKEQRARRIDLVIPASKIVMREGLLELSGADMIERYEDLGDGNKVLIERTDPNGLYRPTAIFDEHIAKRFGIPVSYLRRLREERPDMYDSNVNGWVKGRRPMMRPATDQEIFDGDFEIAQPGDRNVKVLRAGTPGDDRRFFLRLFGALQAENEGLARSLMSNKFAPFDHLDGLMALDEGLTQAGIDRDATRFDRLDLTERGLYARVAIPEIQALAPNLVNGYRNPFAGGGAERAAPAVRGRDIDEWRVIAAREGMGYTEEEGGEPVVFAGMGFSNSENGNGSWRTWPEVIVKVCKNGLQLNVFADVHYHIGARLDEGVHWSDKTHGLGLELVVSQTKDLITRFLSQDFLDERVAEIEQKAGVEIGFDTKATDHIKVVGKKVGFSEGHVEGILNFYLRGGQPTAGGVANAITAYSQTVVSPDTAHELDAKALPAMELVAVRR